MQKITAITPTSRDPNRMTIRVGRRVAATVSLESMTELQLVVNQPWNAALATRVMDAANLDKALLAAGRRLNRQAKTVQQMRIRLKKLGFDESTQQRTIDRLIQRGLLDDEAFGRALIDELILRRSAGANLLRHKLLEKGLETSLVTKLVAEVAESDDPYSRALVLARIKLADSTSLALPTRRRRLYGQLTRRGFDLETAEAVVNELLGQD